MCQFVSELNNIAYQGCFMTIYLTELISFAPNKLIFRAENIYYVFICKYYKHTI